MINRKASVLYAVALSGIGAFALPTSGLADTYTFTAAGCAVCSAGAPIGTVTTSFSGGVETILIQMAQTYTLFEAGNPPEVAFNVTGAPALSYTFPTVQSGTWSDSGAQGPLGATGSFNESIGTTSHNVNLGQTLSFSFLSASAASFFQNDKGFTFAVDLCTVIDATCSGGKTGFAGAVFTNATSSVPLPSAALLFGSGLLGLSFLRKRRRAKQIPASA